MKYKLLIIARLIIVNILLYGQGLNYEKGINDNYNQVPCGIVCNDEFTYFGKKTHMSGSFFTFSTIEKLDTNGSTLWTSQILPVTTEYTNIDKMIASKEGGIFVCGNGYPCDVLSFCFDYVEKYSPDGVMLWSHVLWDSLCYGYHITEISTDLTDNLYFSYKTDYSNLIYILNSNGDFTDTVELNVSDIKNIAKLSGNNYICSCTDTLYGFDSNGNITHSKLFSSKIQNLLTRNDTLFLLTEDSLFLLDSVFQNINSSGYSGNYNLSHLKLNPNNIKFSSETGTENKILTTDYQLQLIDSITILADTTLIKDFSEQHISLAYQFPLAEYYSIRLMDFSTTDPHDTILFNNDVGVIDLIANQIYVDSIYPYYPDVYETNLDISVILKNFGPDTVRSCRLNCNQYYGICNQAVLTQVYYGLNLAPNDTMKIDFGWIGTMMLYYPNQGDTIKRLVCIYSSNPNSLVDTNTVNDRLCKEFALTIVNTDEINNNNDIDVYPNPTSGKLKIQADGIENVEIFNNNGRKIYSGKEKTIDISSQPKGIYIIKIITDKSIAVKKVVLD